MDNIILQETLLLLLRSVGKVNMVKIGNTWKELCMWSEDSNVYGFFSVVAIIALRYFDVIILTENLFICLFMGYLTTLSVNSLERHRLGFILAVLKEEPLINLWCNT